MLQLAGEYTDICYIPPWIKMSPEEARKIVQDSAERHNRQENISFAYAHTPLGPTDHYDQLDYGNHVEEASRNGFEYFITAWPLARPPWENEASAPKDRRVSQIFARFR